MGHLQNAVEAVRDFIREARSVDPSALPREARLVLDELRDEMAFAHKPMDDGESFSIATGAAYLLTCLLDPESGLDMNQQEDDVRSTLGALLSQLEALGLMWAYEREGGGYGFGV